MTLLVWEWAEAASAPRSGAATAWTALQVPGAGGGGVVTRIPVHLAWTLGVRVGAG